VNGIARPQRGPLRDFECFIKGCPADVHAHDCDESIAGMCSRVRGARNTLQACSFRDGVLSHYRHRDAFSPLRCEPEGLFSSATAQDEQGGSDTRGHAALGKYRQVDAVQKSLHKGLGQA